MYDFCPYCGKQLENGEKCNTCRPREYQTYDAPPENNSYNDTHDYNYRNNTNYNQSYNPEYEAERMRYDAEFKSKTDKKNVIVLSVVSLILGCEAIFSFWTGFFALISGIASLSFAINAKKKNKKLEKPIPVANIAFVISIIGIIVGIISFAAMIILLFGDGYTFIFEN